MKHHQQHPQEKSAEASRRTFMKWGMISGFAAAISSLMSNRANATPVEQKDQVKMLTADGKLVLVNKRAANKATGRIKATDSEIRNFVTRPNPKQS